MKKTGKKAGKKRIGYDRLGMLCISLIVLLLLAVLMQKSRSMSATLGIYNARAESLMQQIEDEKARTEEISRLKEYMQTDAFAEQTARERLGLVKENEIVFEEEEN
ncbi:MAG: cell division protein FtsH [Eubacteriales bacterium]|nr:cell division protein FtsH [Eubacteriales bacterium]